MLQQRGFYTIELSDGEKIILRFCTWTFKRFCEKNGNLLLQQFNDLLINGFSLSQFVSLILCASEYEFAKNNTECKFNDVNASDWIDEMGGIGGDKFIEMIKVVTQSFGGNNNHQQKKSKQEPVKS